MSKKDSSKDNQGKSKSSLLALSRSSWPLYYYTVKNMKARQLAGIVERKFRHLIVPRLPFDFDDWYNQQIPEMLEPNPEPVAANLAVLRESYDSDTRSEYQTLASEAADGTIRFLNSSIDFGTMSEIDWEHELLDEYPLLWRLKLQSFEHLEWLTLGFEEPNQAIEIDAAFRQCLLSWADENPIGEKNYLRRSWIPHSVSLRILNWSRYAAWREEEPEKILEIYKEIYRNALFLENHVEWDVDGNHLIENAVALIMAGVLFQNHEQEWLETGVDILNHTAKTQFLSDGGHYERSPMYHIMVLMRYLTAVDLLSRTGNHVPGPVKQTAEDGVRYLRAIQTPEGRIPLLNDAVYEEIESAATCLEYADHIGIAISESPPMSALEASGYYWLSSEDMRMLIDCGVVGPPHLPGHSHNDQLSFNLWVDGQPFVVDTGTYEYAPTENRQYSRSVKSHNTIQVENQEPIAIGGQFLMGRRITPEVIRYETSNRKLFEGLVCKQSLTKTGYTHRRQIKLTDNQWRIRDDVTNGSFISRIHFHPDISVNTVDDKTYVARSESSAISVTPVSTPVKTDIVTTDYYPQFGVCNERETIKFSTEKRSEKIEYILKKESLDRGEQEAELGVVGK